MKSPRRRDYEEQVKLIASQLGVTERWAWEHYVRPFAVQEEEALRKMVEERVN